MGMFEDVKSMMDDYIKKTNEIHASTATISTDIQTFNNTDIITPLNDLKTSVKELTDAINDSSLDDTDAILAEVQKISDKLDKTLSGHEKLQNGYTKIDNTIKNLTPTISDWIKKSSMIFSETVGLLEKAKAQGCK